MIIDLILDRKAGGSYNPDHFFLDCMKYGDVGEDITKAFTFGDEEDVKDAICQYINANEYDPAICDYVKSVIWTKNTDSGPYIPYFV